jgi:hypothetical protein
MARAISQTLIPPAAVPDKEACYQQRNSETTDNNAKCYLSYQGHNVHAAGDASNSHIQASIARLALSILCGVAGPWSWIRLESAIPTWVRASFSAPPLDRFKIAAFLALPSVAKTADLGVAIDSASIAAFAALNSSLWTM